MTSITTTQRLLSLTLASVVTLALGQMIDSLASRDQGATMLARAASSLVQAPVQTTMTSHWSSGKVE